MKLKVSAEQCVGCRQCEATCSMAHEGFFAPWLSRVHIARDEAILLATPVICRQCKNARCEKACAFSAIQAGQDGILSVDREKCTGCGACVTACPFHAMVFDSVGRKAMKCDLCGGDPECVKVCPAKVLVAEE